jgi:4-amino-4-deoxy-L-arabinose transferase-like glycosyltransferase
LVAAATIPLTEDEAYYRLWAEHLSFGYFDHPPMVAWWIAAGRSLFGDTALGDRLAPTLATTLVSLFLVDTARLLGLSAKIGERAGIWYNAAFLIALGGAVVTPDAPATFFWAGTLWAIIKAWRSGVGAWWLLAGLAAGMATLSKYSGLFLGPGVLLWLLVSPKGRAELRRPWPWLALLVGAAVFSPNLIWNATHHWLSFSKQFSRIAPSHFTPRHVLDFPATQFFLLNPLIAVFAVRGIMRVGWTAPAERGLTLIPLGMAPFFLYLVIHSFHAGVQAHWPAPLYPGIALLAAFGAGEETGGRVWRAMARAVPWLGFGVSAVVLLHMALPQTDVLLGRKDPVAPLRGWSAMAARVEALRGEVGAGWVGTQSYGTAAELLAQDKTAAPILELIERGRYSFQGQVASPRGTGLVVELSRRISDKDLIPCFAKVRRLADMERGEPGGEPKVDLVSQGCREGKDRTGKDDR